MPKKTAKVFDLEGKNVKKIDLPDVFLTPIRADVIKRAVLAIQSSRFQPQGRDYMAGKRTSAESRGTGSAAARIPRIKGGRGTAAFAPGTVGGRLPFPPTPEKKIVKKIPRKEKRLALMSAIAATGQKSAVASRGHSIEDVGGFPLIVTDDLESLKKTKEVEEALIHLGVLSEIFRVKESRKVRAGKGKARGRKMKQAVGPLIVINEDKGVAKAAGNILGVETVMVNKINAEMLAPGTHPGRLAIWTEGAITQLNRIYGNGEEA